MNNMFPTVLLQSSIKVTYDTHYSAAQPATWENKGAERHFFGLPRIQRPTLKSRRNLLSSLSQMSHSGPIAGGMAMGAPPPPSVMDTRNNGSSRQYAEKEIYQYDAPWQVYALDWSKAPGDRDGFRIAVGSLIEEQTNKVKQRKESMPCVYCISLKTYTIVRLAASYYANRPRCVRRSGSIQVLRRQTATSRLCTPRTNRFLLSDYQSTVGATQGKYGIRREQKQNKAYTMSSSFLSALHDILIFLSHPPMSCEYGSW